MELEYLLKRGVAEVIVESELVDRLRSGQKLRLKEGLDPSAPDIHLGHMVGLRKLRQFQEMGHQVVLIVGDWTARIGDPSGASVTRPMLTAEQVNENAQTYMQQFFKIVDKDKTEVRWQSEWFDKFTLETVVRLTSKFTVAQFLAREDFNNRFNAGKPIAITELLYPLMQAYDSVAIEADVEFGGTDQKFNLLVGRELQAMMGQPSQQIFLVPLLVGIDGGRKMSKSLGNYIGVTDPPEEMYGKTMSIRDDLIMDYFELLTDVPDKELAGFRESLEHNEVNPMELKKRLAREIIVQLYDEKKAIEAAAHFAKTVQQKEVPENIEECRFSFADYAFPDSEEKDDTGRLSWVGTGSDDFDISQIIVKTGQAKSRSEAMRLIKQGAVSIDGEKVTGNVAEVKSGSIIKVGKRRYARVINTDRV